jgi:hypothetical protein
MTPIFAKNHWYRQAGRLPDIHLSLRLVGSRNARQLFAVGACRWCLRHRNPDQGEKTMKPLIIAAVLAVPLTFGPGMALAQSSSNPGSGQNSAATGYSVKGGAAHLGDGSNPNYLKTQKELLTEPGYSVGPGDVAKNATNQNGNAQPSNK